MAHAHPDDIAAYRAKVIQQFDDAALLCLCCIEQDAPILTPDPEPETEPEIHPVLRTQRAYKRRAKKIKKQPTNTPRQRRLPGGCRSAKRSKACV
jgi:hypothetical protein